MRLVIADPTALVVDEPDVTSIRAEDGSGSFGVLQGHADFLTTLPPSVIAWRTARGQERFCAVRRGILTVQGGAEVMVSTREAHPGEDLDRLEAEVVARYRSEAEQERTASTAAARLRMQTIRRIVEALKGGVRLGAELQP